MMGIGWALGVLIVLMSAKATFLKAHQTVKDTRRTMRDLRRRQQALSLKIRSLARENLAQRVTAGQDESEVDQIQYRISELQRQVDRLELEDRRILVLDERRGLSETGWIVCIRRLPDVASPLEPRGITALWDEGRFVFCYAGDMARARRKVMVRFTEEAGYQIIDVRPHEGDLSDPPNLMAPVADGQKRRA